MDDVEFVLPTPQTAGRGPQKLIPRFFTSTKEDKQASAKEGRVVCKDVEMVEFRIPGNVKDIYTERVSQKIVDEYPEEYRHWKAKQTQLVQGTPLKQYPKFTSARCMELNLAGVLTLEQLINLTDGQMQKTGMGVRKEIAEVKAWMEFAKDTAIVTRQAAENQQLKDRCADLERQIRELAERFDEKKRPTLRLAKNDVS